MNCKSIAISFIVFTSIHLSLQFLIVKENRGNEGTCIGVSRHPVKDWSHRTTGDMWLYRYLNTKTYENIEQMVP